MRSKLVLAGRFRVFEDGHVNRVTKSGEMDAPISMVGKARKYAQVSFCEDGKTKTVYVHRLIASAFIPNPDNLPTVNHIDGDTSNNSVDNLEWVSYSENMRHAYRVGLNNPMAYGQPCKTCGMMVRSKTGYCSKCRLDFQKDKKREEVHEERKNRYKKIDINQCSETEKKYVTLALQGMTMQSIADIFGVDRKSVV